MRSNHSNNIAGAAQCCLLRAVLVFGLVCLRMLAAASYPASGMVVAVDRGAATVTISHGAIPGYMDAMTMAFQVRDGKVPAGLKPGDAVKFTLVVERLRSGVTGLTVVPFESAERDPVAAARLKILDAATGRSAPHGLAVGDSVPDFTLGDQNGRAVSLSQFRGKVVAIDFIYTRCPLPDYCFRLSSNFSRIRKRFRGREDLVLLTVTFDPIHDTPQVLAGYAKIWNPDGLGWHFLTGAPKDVQRVCSLFGVAYWQDDGFFTHSLHSVVIDRNGRLAANVEGNKVAAQQLGDLVEHVLRPTDR